MSLSNMFTVVLSCWLCFCFWTGSAETNDVEQLILRQKAFETWMMQDMAYVNKQLNKLEEEFKILSRSMQQSLPQNEISTHTNDQLSQTSIRLTKAFSDNKKAVAERISGLSTHVSEVEKQLRESIEETTAERESILATIAKTVHDAQQRWSEKLEERISGVRSELQNGTSTIGKELLVDHNILIENVASIDNLNTSLAILEKQLRKSVEETTAGRESILTTIAETVQEAQKGWSEKIEERISGLRLELQTVISTKAKELEEDHNILIENVASIDDLNTSLAILEKQLRESVKETTTGRESILTTVAETVQEAQQGWSEKLEERISGLRSELQNGISKIGKDLLVDHNILIETVASIDDLKISSTIVMLKLDELTMQLNRKAPDHFIRLVGPDRNMGRVEIFFMGQWGTVCNDQFDTNNNSANVVCKMLGFSAGEVTMRFGPGSGPIWLDDVECSGSEENILRCERNQIGMHNCNHGEDAGVICR